MFVPRNSQIAGAFVALAFVAVATSQELAGPEAEADIKMVGDMFREHAMGCHAKDNSVIFGVDWSSTMPTASATTVQNVLKTASAALFGNYQKLLGRSHKQVYAGIIYGHGTNTYVRPLRNTSALFDADIAAAATAATGATPAATTNFNKILDSAKSEFESWSVNGHHLSTGRRTVVLIVDSANAGSMKDLSASIGALSQIGAQIVVVAVGTTAKRAELRRIATSHEIFAVPDWNSLWKALPGVMAEVRGDKAQTCVAFGDPHYVTFDGLPYTFQGHGDFWLFKSGTFNVQTRQLGCRARPGDSTQSAPYPKVAGVTCGRGIAASDGESFIELLYDPDNNALQYRLNQKSLPINTTQTFGSATPKSMMSVRRYSSGGFNVKIDFSFGTVPMQQRSTVQIVFVGRSSSVFVTPSPLLFGSGAGLCGSFDGCPKSDARGPSPAQNPVDASYDADDMKRNTKPASNYTVSVDPAAAEAAMFAEQAARSGLKWRVHDSESLFTDLPGETRRFAPKTGATPTITDPRLLATADKACNGLNGFLATACKADVAATGDEKAAMGAKLVQWRICNDRCMYGSPVASSHVVNPDDCTGICSVDGRADLWLHKNYNDTMRPPITLAPARQDKMAAFFNPDLRIGGRYVVTAVATLYGVSAVKNFTIDVPCDAGSKPTAMPGVNNTKVKITKDLGYPTVVMDGKFEFADVNRVADRTRVIVSWKFISVPRQRQPLFKHYGTDLKTFRVDNSTLDNKFYSVMQTPPPLPSGKDSWETLPHDPRDIPHIEGAESLTPHWTPEYPGKHVLEMAVSDGCFVDKKRIVIDVECSSCNSPSTEIEPFSNVYWSGLNGKFPTLQLNATARDGDNAWHMHYAWDLVGFDSMHRHPGVPKNINIRRVDDFGVWGWKLNYIVEEVLQPAISEKNKTKTVVWDKKNMRRTISGTTDDGVYWPERPNMVTGVRIPNAVRKIRFQTWVDERSTKTEWESQPKKSIEWCRVQVRPVGGTNAAQKAQAPGSPGNAVQHILGPRQENSTWGLAAEIQWTPVLNTTNTSNFHNDSSWGSSLTWGRGCAGIWKIRGTVYDDCHTSNDEANVVVGCGPKPRAHALCDKDVVFNYWKRAWPAVTLNAKGSYEVGPKDGQRKSLRYQWRLLNQPWRSNMDFGRPTNAFTFSSPSTASTSFTPGERGTYTFGVEVSNGCQWDRAHVTTRATCPRHTPLTFVKTPVTTTKYNSLHSLTNATAWILDSTGSNLTIPNVVQIGHIWKVTAVPTINRIWTLSNETWVTSGQKPNALDREKLNQVGSPIFERHGVNTTIMPNVKGTYTVQKLTWDGCLNSTKTVSFTLGCGCSWANINTQVTANPGNLNYQYTYSGINARKFGQAYINAAGIVKTCGQYRGSTTTYAYRLRSVPTGSALTNTSITTNSSGAMAFFTPDKKGTYVADAVIFDGCNWWDKTYSWTAVCSGTITPTIVEIADRTGGFTVGNIGSSNNGNITLNFTTTTPHIHVTVSKFRVIRVADNVVTALSGNQVSGWRYNPTKVGAHIFELTLNDGCNDFKVNKTFTATCYKKLHFGQIHVQAPTAQFDRGVMWTGISDYLYLNVSYGRTLPAGVTAAATATAAAAWDNWATHTWKVVEQPRYSTVTLTAVAQPDAGATFKADKAGMYIIELTTSNGCDYKIQNVTVEVKCSKLEARPRAWVTPVNADGSQKFPSVTGATSVIASYQGNGVWDRVELSANTSVIGNHTTLPNPLSGITHRWFVKSAPSGSVYYPSYNRSSTYTNSTSSPASPSTGSTRTVYYWNETTTHKIREEWVELSPCDQQDDWFAACFYPDTAGEYVLTLEVKTGCKNSTADVKVSAQCSSAGLVTKPDATNSPTVSWVGYDTSQALASQTFWLNTTKNNRIHISGWAEAPTEVTYWVEWGPNPMGWKGMQGIAAADGPKPSFVPKKPGTYNLMFMYTDGCQLKQRKREIKVGIRQWDPVTGFIGSWMVSQNTATFSQESLGLEPWGQGLYLYTPEAWDCFDKIEWKYTHYTMTKVIFGDFHAPPTTPRARSTPAPLDDEVETIAGMTRAAFGLVVAVAVAAAIGIGAGVYFIASKKAMATVAPA